MRPDEPALAADASSSLEATLAPLLAAQSGRSGVVLVNEGAMAYAIRQQSADLAGRSLDLQYYIWHDDLTGRLLARTLLAAADRGVRVRILLDDVDARGKRGAIHALDAHPRIAVRLFNPLRSRSGPLRSMAEMGLRFGRLNHRMHNKAWIADDALAIVGGRNIGDEYFAASPDVNFSDLDLALVGPAARAFAHGFERYWTDEASLDLATIDAAVTGDETAALRKRLDAFATDSADAPYVRALSGQMPLEERLATKTFWSDRVQPLIDDPRKIRDGTNPDPGVLEGLRTAFDAAERELILVSPYFVPGDGGVDFLAALRKRDVAVSVLTNSLAATDVAAVHAGYARSRPALVDAGVVLHEVRPGSARKQEFNLGGSKASLHTKAALIDDGTVFVGSFNLDPRSARINCEQGVLVESRELSALLRERFEHATADGVRTWRVERGPDGKGLRWRGRSDEDVVGRDPESTAGRRATAWFAGVLPLESQL